MFDANGKLIEPVPYTVEYLYLKAGQPVYSSIVVYGTSDSYKGPMPPYEKKIRAAIIQKFATFGKKVKIEWIGDPV